MGLMKEGNYLQGAAISGMTQAANREAERDVANLKVSSDADQSAISTAGSAFGATLAVGAHMQKNGQLDKFGNKISSLFHDIF